jgi:2-haloacid dehalogenase
MIKTVFLDLDDTILDFQYAEHFAIKETFSKIGLEPTNALLSRYIEINRSCWAALERGELSREEVLTRRFEILFSELGVEISPSETQDTYARLLGSCHKFLDGGEELLREFERLGKYDLYIASNGIYIVQEPRIRESGIAKYFKDIFISEKIGFNKPSVEFFESCFDKIDGFKRDEAIIVGDSLSSDIQGGINAGIKTCHFNPKGIWYKDVRPDYSISDLSELIPLLDQIK